VVDGIAARVGFCKKIMNIQSDSPSMLTSLFSKFNNEFLENVDVATLFKNNQTSSFSVIIKMFIILNEVIFINRFTKISNLCNIRSRVYNSWTIFTNCNL